MSYTPTAEQVAHAYCDGLSGTSRTREESQGEFDRWLTQEKAEAWHEGVMTALNSEGNSAGERARALLGNPYRNPEK